MALTTTHHGEKIKVHHNVLMEISAFRFLSFFMAIQHYLTMIGAIVSIPFILTPALCMEDENPERGTIICTMIFVTGLVTIIQTTWGCRMPLIQVHCTTFNCLFVSGFIY